LPVTSPSEAVAEAPLSSPRFMDASSPERASGRSNSMGDGTLRRAAEMVTSARGFLGSIWAASGPGGQVVG